MFPSVNKKQLKEDAKKLEDFLKDKIRNRKSEDKTWSEEDFEKGFLVGRGKFGHVYIAREKESEFIVALKEMYKKSLEKEDMFVQVAREIKIQYNLKHPNILSLYTCFSTPHKIVLVLEFAGLGELYKCLRRQPQSRFKEPRVAQYMYQVADAISYCHKNYVMHRDIKPENLLLDIHGNIKLADFGWSVLSPHKRTTLCGTLDYLAPEIVEDRAYNEKLDNWSIGILCYELLTGRAPFQSGAEEETLRKIANIEISYPDFLSQGAKDLVSKLLKCNPDDRLSLTEVMNHNWILSNKILFKSSFSVD